MALDFCSLSRPIAGAYRPVVARDGGLGSINGPTIAASQFDQKATSEPIVVFNSELLPMLKENKERRGSRYPAGLSPEAAAGEIIAPLVAAPMYLASSAQPVHHLGFQTEHIYKSKCEPLSSKNRVNPRHTPFLEFDEYFESAQYRPGAVICVSRVRERYATYLDQRRMNGNPRKPFILFYA